MKVENPVALRFILPDELYLLKVDKAAYENPAIAEPEIAVATPVQKTVEIPTLTPAITPPIPTVTVTAAAPVTPVIETPAASFKYMGKNQKRFLVLVHYPNLAFIDEAHLTALTNIIKRKELGVDDLAIVNIATQPTARYDELEQFFKPTRVLILGQKAMPQAAPTLTLNTPKLLAGLANLYSYSFDEMMDNVEYKKAFWEQVKGF